MGFGEAEYEEVWRYGGRSSREEQSSFEASLQADHFETKKKLAVACDLIFKRRDLSKEEHGRLSVWYRNWRKDRKQDYIRKCEARIAQIKNDFSQIEILGGIPSEEKKKQLQAAETTLQEAFQTNEMTTQLY